MGELVLASVADAAAALDHATAQVRAGEIAQCVAIAALCDLHRVDENVLVEGCERWVPGGADGTPLIGEFVLGEIATLLEVSVGAAFTHTSRVLNLRHRHPTLWNLVITGDIRVREGFWVADAAALARLDAAACARFDRLCAQALALWPWARVRKNLDKWLILADPQQAVVNAALAAGRRHVRVGSIADGHVGVWGQLDAADGIALDEALNQIADGLDGDDRDHRRASALGVMARSVLGQDTLPASSMSNGRAPASRRAEVIVRLDHTGVAALDGWGHVLESQLDGILSGCQVTVRPIVIDTEVPAVDGYRVPDRMRRVLGERNPVDVFPWGTRHAGSCQVDHTTPYMAGVPGQTRLANLGPLSSFTHRLKTHGGWQLDQPRPGVFVWRSPLGYEYQVTSEGTICVRRPPPPEYCWWHQEPPDPDPPDNGDGDVGEGDGVLDPGGRQAPLPDVA